MLGVHTTKTRSHARERGGSLRSMRHTLSLTTSTSNNQQQRQEYTSATTKSSYPSTSSLSHYVSSSPCSLPGYQRKESQTPTVHSIRAYSLHEPNSFTLPLQLSQRIHRSKTQEHSLDQIISRKLSAFPKPRTSAFPGVIRARRLLWGVPSGASRFPTFLPPIVL